MQNSPENISASEENTDAKGRTSKIEAIGIVEFYHPSYSDMDGITKAEQYADDLAEEAHERDSFSYIPFDPVRELRKIRNLSPEENTLPPSEKRKMRRERILEFKKNMMLQKEGIARIINDLVDAVRSSPDLTKEALTSKVMAFAPQYKLTEHNIFLFEYAIEEYADKHAAVEKYRAMYENNADLFEACFGMKPKGKVEVIKGPMTLCFRCFDKTDYAFASSFSKHRGDEKRMAFEDLDFSSINEGVSLGEVKIEELDGTVTIENVSDTESAQIDGYSERVRIHEDQHQLNRLFIPLEAREDRTDLMRRATVSANTREEAIRGLIHGLARYERKYIGFDSLPRDEILAYYKDGQDPGAILYILDNPTNSKFYGYAEILKERISKIPLDIKYLLKHAVSEVFYEGKEDGGKAAVDAEALEVDVSEIQPYVESVFGDEYKADLKMWIGSISALEGKGYERDEIIALLYAEPINSWPKLARRMKPKEIAGSKETGN